MAGWVVAMFPWLRISPWRRDGNGDGSLFFMDVESDVEFRGRV